MNVCDEKQPTCDSVSKDSLIELEPFIHQVGGRSTILVLGEYICKPINVRELAFYESIDQYAATLKPFIARFNGTISVNFEESNDGYFMITTKSRSQDSNTVDNKSQSTSQQSLNSLFQSCSSPYQKFVTKYRIKFCRPLKEIIIESHEQDLENDISFNLESSKKQLEDLILTEKCGELGGMSLGSTMTNTSNLCRSRSTSISIPNFEDAGQNGCKACARNDTSPQISHHSSEHSSPLRSHRMACNKSTTKHNPWVLKTFSTLSEFNESMKEQKFILLENLAANFEYPCIMDLKMGTRLHDDGASQTKIQSHESKVNETTSGALGLRITGIQIYDEKLERFICYNKYYGRKLTPESFRSTLKMFISNQNFRQHNLLEKMIEKLKELRSVIVELKSFRFYTSSLLLIYEGNVCKCPTLGGGNETCASSEELNKLFDVRLIDFAHSTHANLSSFLSPSSSPVPNAATHQDYDEGFVFGLDNLIKIFTLFKSGM